MFPSDSINLTSSENLSDAQSGISAKNDFVMRVNVSFALKNGIAEVDDRIIDKYGSLRDTNTPQDSSEKRFIFPSLLVILYLSSYFDLF